MASRIVKFFGVRNKIFRISVFLFAFFLFYFISPGSAFASYAGEYWNLPSPAASPSFPGGSPNYTRTDSDINFNWGESSPAPGTINIDGFVARWTETKNFDAGTYYFSATSDDGVRVYVDSTLILNSWIDQAPKFYSASSNISAGSHTIKVEYYENGGGAVCQFSYYKRNPSVSTFSPSDNATGISPTGNLVLNFDQTVYTSASGSNDFVIKKASDDSTIETIDAKDAKVSGHGTSTITINPAATFEEQTAYYVQIGSDAVYNGSGYYYGGISDSATWNFTTGDFTNPAVSTYSPADDAADIDTTAILVLTFTEPVTAKAGADNDIVIKKISNNFSVETIDALDAKVTGSGTTAIAINPEVILDEQTAYYVQIGADAFDDTAGNSYAGISSTTAWNFTTEDVTAPSGGLITYTDGYNTTGSVSLTSNDGAENGSGINSSSRIVQRKSATLSDGTCGSFGIFSTISSTGAYPNLTDATATSGNCYKYQYLVSDMAGNQAAYTSSNIAKVDTDGPITDAGSDETKNAQFSKNGAASDNVSGIAGYLWEKQSGPGIITFGTATDEDTTVSTDTDGTYVIRFTTNDNAGNSAYDEFTLTWDASAPGTPAVSPPSGTYTSTQSVELTSAGSSEIYYTTDGDTPTASSALYSSAITVDHSMTIKALAVDAIGNESPVLTAHYTVNLDSDSPSISSVRADPSASSAEVTWKTNEDSSSQVEYGLASSYGNTTSEFDTSPRVTSHSVSLSGLQSCAKYYFRVKSEDESSNNAVSSRSTFYTSGCEASQISDGEGDFIDTSGGSVSIATAQGTAALIAPENFYSETAAIQLNMLEMDNSPSAPSGMNFVNDNFFELLAVSSNGEKIDNFDHTVTFTVNYGSDTENQYVESTLDVYKYFGGTWTKKDCALDTGANTLTCLLNSFSSYAVLGDENVEDAPIEDVSNENTPVEDTPVENISTEAVPDKDAQKARVDSWKAKQYTTDGSCSNKLKLTIKGRHFNKGVEVRIGGTKADDVDRENSRKMTAKFCLDDLFGVKTDYARKIHVINPNADTAKAKKKIHLDRIGPDLRASINNFDPESSKGVKNIQQALVNLGFLNSQCVTGTYGPLTIEAVKKFQQKNGLPTTGYSGPLTKAKFMKKFK
ncbi:MAG: Ig-like domain-containing protein [Parcubacteria group bacterium]|jgi:hypothetical protein